MRHAILGAGGVGLIVAGALVVGWLGASLTQPAAPAQSRVAGVNSRRPLGVAASVPQAERLRERMPSIPTPSRGRNPFVYAPRVVPRPVSSDNGRTDSLAAVPPAPVPPVAPAGPVFKLSGIASNADDHGFVTLIAIMNDNGSLLFAKAGDKLSNGYSVVKVDEMSVTLADAAGVTQTIRLP
jgi:hypothetical protein